jgi:hypothetical protein
MVVMDCLMVCWKDSVSHPSNSLLQIDMLFFTKIDDTFKLHGEAQQYCAVLWDKILLCLLLYSGKEILPLPRENRNAHVAPKELEWGSVAISTDETTDGS